MMLDICLRFPRCINELLKRVTGTSYRYFTNPVASYYLQPTLGDVDINFCDLAKLPKPLSGCLSKKQLDEIRQWVQQYGKSVRQNTTRNFSTKDKPGTLPLNHGLPKYEINKLQSVQNTTAGVIACIRKFDHISDTKGVALVTSGAKNNL